MQGPVICQKRQRSDSEGMPEHRPKQWQSKGGGSWLYGPARHQGNGFRHRARVGLSCRREEDLGRLVSWLGILHHQGLRVFLDRLGGYRFEDCLP